MTSERWVPVPGTAGQYFVSDLGRVWSRTSKRLMQRQEGAMPYTHIRFEPRGLPHFDRAVHVLVAELFIRPPIGDEVVMHLDDDRYNNRVSNLAVATQAANGAAAALAGRMRKPRLAPSNVLAIYGARMTHRELAELYDVSMNCISDIRRGRTWPQLTRSLPSPPKSSLSKPSRHTA